MSETEKLEVQKKINKIYENKFSELVQLNKLPKKWQTHVENFMYGRSAWYRLHNLMSLRFNVLPKKIGYSMATFRAIRGNKSSIYAILYEDLESKKSNKNISYIALGPSLTSSDGEFRPYFIRADVLLDFYEEYSNIYSHLEDNLIQDVESGELQFGVELHIFNDEFKKSNKWSQQIDESRYTVKFYTYVWLLMFWQYDSNISFNHISPSFHSVMFDKNSSILYKALTSFETPDHILKLAEYSGRFYISVEMRKRLNLNSSTLRLGHKLIPLTVADVRHFKNPRYRPWKELYVDYMVGKLVINLITPGLPIMGEYFFVQNTSHGMFDNDAMHTKLDLSQVGENITESLELIQTQTLNTSSEKDDEQFLNIKFKQLSDQLDASIEYTEEEIIMSGISIVKVVEYIGFTIRDIVRIGGKDPREMVGPLLTSQRLFAKYIFEIVYTLMCLNTKLGVIQGDLHLNNAVIFPMVRTDHSKNETIVIYQIGDKYYKFPHYGSFGGVIDFSRAIVTQSQIRTDYGEEFAGEFIQKQKNAILSIYKMFFPDFYTKYSFKLNEYLKENFDMGFKVATAIDSYRLFGDMIILLKSSSERILPANIKLLERIRNISLNILTEKMQSVLVKNDIMTEFPHELILRECFSEFTISSDEPLPETERLCDYYHYDRSLIYNHVSEKDFPEIMSKQFNIQMRKINSDAGIKPREWMTAYSKYRKDIPQDFTDMVKNLRKTPIKLPIEQKKK